MSQKEKLLTELDHSKTLVEYWSNKFQTLWKAHKLDHNQLDLQTKHLTQQVATLQKKLELESHRNERQTRELYLKQEKTANDLLDKQKKARDLREYHR